jgi:hypothetical protein
VEEEEGQVQEQTQRNKQKKMTVKFGHDRQSNISRFCR